METSHRGNADSAVGDAVLLESQRCLDACLNAVRHCLDQLTDDQVWWRPHPSMNAIGNLILHLEGNLKQWIVAGIGDGDYVRDRPGEFARRGEIGKTDLVEQLEATVAAAQAVLKQCTAQSLLEPRRIQGFEVTGVGAIFDSLPHLKGHTQEIICLARMQLGDSYRFRWQPTTPEQGAP